MTVTNRVFYDDGTKDAKEGWYFVIAGWASCYGPFATKLEAEQTLDDYIKRYYTQ